MDMPTAGDGQSSSVAPHATGGLLGPLWRWLDERLGLRALHYPVPAYSNSIWYTLGGITLMGFIILGATGVYLSQFYHPHPTEARDSIIYLVTRVDFGNFVRSVHYWTANLVVVTVALHLLRVFWSGSYKKPRELNWIIGVTLLVLTGALFFSGTVLKWDQEAYEALKHNEAAAKLLGSLGSVATSDFTRSVPLLTRLYVVHTSILPGILTFLVLLHLFLVKHHKISPLPRRGGDGGMSHTEGDASGGGEDSFFDLHARKLAGYGLLLAALAAVLALALPAALGPQAVPGIEITKPAWLFWWPYAFENWWGIRALLVATILAPLALLLVPFMDRSPRRHILDRRWAAGVMLLAVLTGIGLTLYVWVTPVAQHLGG